MTSVVDPEVLFSGISTKDMVMELRRRGALQELVSKQQVDMVSLVRLKAEQLRKLVESSGRADLINMALGHPDVVRHESWTEPAKDALHYRTTLVVVLREHHP